MDEFWKTLRWPPRRLVLWHSIAAIPMATVVLLGAYLSYHYHQLTIQNRDRVDRAYQVLDVVDGLFISMQNADVAERDFIITGDGSHLATFVTSLQSEREDARHLQDLLVASPLQEALLAKLDMAVAAKVTDLGQAISVRQNQGFNAAQLAIRNGDDGKAMADIRKLVTALSENERRFLNRRQADTREHERDTLLVGIFIAALSVTTRILIALGIRHVHSKRQAAIVEAEAEAEATPPGAVSSSGA
ncbi:MAG: CHASE3 domain-containing protein [Burkholderiaceae bacterium]